VLLKSTPSLIPHCIQRLWSEVERRTGQHEYFSLRLCCQGPKSGLTAEWYVSSEPPPNPGNAAPDAFCAQQGTHAVVLTANARDVYQGAFSASRAFASGGVFAAGNTDLHFRCAR